VHRARTSCIIYKKRRVLALRSRLGATYHLRPRAWTRCFGLCFKHSISFGKHKHRCFSISAAPVKFRFWSCLNASWCCVYRRYLRWKKTWWAFGAVCFASEFVFVPSENHAPTTDGPRATVAGLQCFGFGSDCGCDDGCKGWVH